MIYCKVYYRQWAVTIFIIVMGLFESASAQDSRWLKLMYYESSGDNKFHSLITTKSYFLSDRGRTDPFSELEKSKNLLRPLREFPMEITKKITDFICAFPARFQYVASLIGVDYRRYRCDKVEAWVASFEAEGVSIIFASQYLSNPASAMGHTYLRLISAQRVLFLNKVIGYAAFVPKDVGFFSYVQKGLGGGFVGEFSVDPFYFKFHEYSNMEFRDLWEYELDLNHEEVELLLRHLWELIHHAQFDYLFLSENCAKILLRVLEVVKPAGNLVANLPFFVLPLESLRMVQSAGMVKQIRYYPSLSSKGNQKYSRLSEMQRRDLDMVLKAQPTHDVEVMDTGMDYLNFERHQKGGKLEPVQSEVYDSLLIARSKHPSKEARESGVAVKDYPHEANPPRRFKFGVGKHNKLREFASVGFRPAIHDLKDRIQGYLQYSEINILNGEFKVFAKERVSLDHLQIFSLKKYTSWEMFNRSPSWGIDVAIKSNDVSPCSSCLYNENNLSIGLGKIFNGGYGVWFSFDEIMRIGNINDHFELDHGLKILGIIDSFDIGRVVLQARPAYGQFEMKNLMLQAQLLFHVSSKYTLEFDVQYKTSQRIGEVYQLQSAIYYYF
ncbi:MAG: hypothetical protein A2X86_09725 [Bdellovibrionales bacterium GWA2_49_15]|nr:MAG: hypothetical protein A2X86_09725 [Bdellovibrionales bacterium GWA2_49_15]HAZ13060.1 hypothetical protein [Bdellovibrionales bacterium]